MTEEGLAWGLLNCGSGRLVRKRTVGKVGVGLTGIGRSVVPVRRVNWAARQRGSCSAYHPPSVSFAFANSSSLPGSVQACQLALGRWVKEGEV